MDEFLWKVADGKYLGTLSIWFKWVSVSDLKSSKSRSK